MMCGLGFPTQIAKDFEYSAGGLCGRTAPVGGWSNTFPIPFYKSAVVTVRADPSDGAGCYGGYVSVRGTPRLPLVLPHSGLPLPTGSRLTLQRQPLALRQPLEFVTLATLLQGQSGFVFKRPAGGPAAGGGYIEGCWNSGDTARQALPERAERPDALRARHRVRVPQRIPPPHLRPARDDRRRQADVARRRKGRPGHHQVVRQPAPARRRRAGARRGARDRRPAAVAGQRDHL